MDTATLSADTLRTALEREPHNAELHYLLGAELAQERNYAEAVTAMLRALDLDPDQHTCRFQLGLLLLTMADPVRARAVWAPLEGSGAPPALQHFRRGLESLINDDFAACIDALRTGIGLNLANPALNRDMQLVIAEAEAALRACGAGTPASDKDGVAPVHSDFSLYGTD